MCIVAGASDTDPLDKQVITPAMLSYLGSFRLPAMANGWSTAFAQGGLAMRRVHGNLQFFTTSHVYSGGLVYEFNDPGLSTTAPYPQASVVTNWGDIYTGQKEDNGNATLSGGCLTYGLLYDPAINGLYWSYGDWYNTAAPYNPSIGLSLLNDATGVATGVGAWSLSNRPEHMERGGATRIPTWYAARFTGGNTLGVGFGGYYSIIGTGSLGPALAAIPDPTLSADPNDSALPNTPLLGFQPAGGSGFAQRTPDYINRAPPGPWSGIVHGASATSLVTDNLLEATNVLVDWTVTIIAGPGAGQTRDVTAWDYQSQTATIATPWSTLPVSGQSTYTLFGGHAQGGSASSITLKATATRTDYAGQYLIITAGTAASTQEQAITAWNPTTQTATVSPGWSTVPDSTSEYQFFASGFGASVPDPVGGVGSWTWCDSIGAGVWIDTPDRQGLLSLSLLGTGHVYYMASNIWSDGQEIEWQVFSPKDLSQVATGSVAESTIHPTAMWIDPTLPVPSAGYSPYPGGATFDPTTNRLYVLIEEAWQDGVEWKPLIAVYQLAGPLAGAATGTGTSTSTGSGSTGGTTGTTTGSATAGSTTGSTAGAGPTTGNGGSSRCGLGGVSLLLVLGVALLGRRLTDRACTRDDRLRGAQRRAARSASPPSRH